MNLDYKEKYLKYKNKYLLAKSLKGGLLTDAQQEIINQIMEKFLNQDFLNLMTIIGSNNTLLTEEKIKLLVEWHKTKLPIGFQFKTKFDGDIKKTKQQQYDSTNNEDNYNFFEEQLKELNILHAVEIERMKKILYNKLLSTIFDDAVTIEQFTELANQRIE